MEEGREGEREKEGRKAIESPRYNRKELSGRIFLSQVS